MRSAMGSVTTSPRLTSTWPRAIFSTTGSTSARARLRRSSVNCESEKLFTTAKDRRSARMARFSESPCARSTTRSAIWFVTLSGVNTWSRGTSSDCARPSCVRRSSMAPAASASSRCPVRSVTPRESATSMRLRASSRSRAGSAERDRETTSSLDKRPGKSACTFSWMVAGESPIARHRENDWENRS